MASPGLLTRLVGTARGAGIDVHRDKVDASRCEAIGLVTAWCRMRSFRKKRLRWPNRWRTGRPLRCRYMKDNLDEALLFDFATRATMKPHALIRTTMTGSSRSGAGFY